MQSHQIILFTLGEASDHRGRYIHDIWRFSDQLLETTHDYIQWLFPIPEVNEVNEFAPVLTSDAQLWFQGNRQLKEQQEKSTDRLLSFLGLVRTADRIAADLDLHPIKHRWLNRFDHNHRRISRMIRSFHLCHQALRAQMLQSAVIEIGPRFGDVPESSIDYWRAANR